MPYKDKEVAKLKARERKQRWIKKNRAEDWTDGRGKHGKHARGEQCGRWNNGKLYTSDGYVLVRVPKDHPLHVANGYAFEHRMVISENIGRWLKANEHVHHINGVKDDNRSENLIVLTKAEHNIIHMTGRIDGKTQTDSFSA